MRHRIRLAIAILLALLALGGGANAQDSRVDVLYAGSLTTVMEKVIGPAFSLSSGLRFQGEGNGSVAAANLIRAGLRWPDVFVSADAAVNEDVLIGERNRNLVDYYVTFAGAAMVLGYNPRSRFSADFERARGGRSAWYEVLARPGLKFGRTDPNLDPKGYRTLFLFSLAEDHYKRAGLMGLLGAPRNPQQVFPETGLMVRVETGQLDAAVLYRHEALAHKLPFIELPDAINQSSPRYGALYRTKSFTTEKGMRVVGSPILFTMAPLNRAKHPSGAAAFMGFVLSPRGLSLLKRAGLTPAPVLVGGNVARMPAELRSRVKGRYVR